jgi:3-oxoacyl-[acyl-carrier protein] reductase
VAKNDSNEFGLTLLAREIFLARHAKEEVGRFVGISSNISAWPYPDEPLYRHQDENHWVHERLANDVASDGITANAVLPGLTNSQAIGPQSEEQKRATWEQPAIKRRGEPEDISAVLFLAGDDAAFITG